MRLEVLLVVVLGWWRTSAQAFVPSGHIHQTAHLLQPPAARRFDQTNQRLPLLPKFHHQELLSPLSPNGRRIGPQSRFIVGPLSLAISSDNVIAGISMVVLALQFGAMPTLQKKFVPREICRSSVVLAQEAAKFCLSACLFFTLLTPWQRHQALVGWSVRSWLQFAALPAFLYSVQNIAKLQAYQYLPAVTYNVLNQTKTLSTALFCYLLLGLRQSTIQMMALLLLLFSALVIEEVVKLDMITSILLMTNPLNMLLWRRFGVTLLGGGRPAKKASALFSPKGRPLQAISVTAGSNKTQSFPNDDNNPSPTTQTPTTSSAPPVTSRRDPYHFSRGVLPLMLANLTSGLAAALGQKALQKQHLDIFVYGMELASVSFLMVLTSLLWSRDGRQIRTEGFRNHWKWPIAFPIGAHAIGGLLVGLVTKHAGSVQKGFALIFGVLLSGLFQKKLSHEAVTKEQIMGGLLACVSLWMHSSYPPAARVVTP
jgi:hypothetical protein